MSRMAGWYQNSKALQFRAIAEFARYRFVFVTPEYNHGTCAALKNAIDFLYQKWTNKAAGFIRDGGAVPSRGTARTIPNGSRQKLQWLIGTAVPLYPSGGAAHGLSALRSGRSFGG